MRDDTPGWVRRGSCIPEGCQTPRAARQFWHPAGVQLLICPAPEVSLRSTSGYLLASLRDGDAVLPCLASIPLETAKNLKAFAWCCRFFNLRAVLASVIAKAFFSSYASPLTIIAQMIRFSLCAPATMPSAFPSRPL